MSTTQTVPLSPIIADIFSTALSSIFEKCKLHCSFIFDGQSISPYHAMMSPASIMTCFSPLGKKYKTVMFSIIVDIAAEFIEYNRKLLELIAEMVPMVDDTIPEVKKLINIEMVKREDTSYKKVGFINAPGKKNNSIPYIVDYVSVSSNIDPDTGQLFNFTVQNSKYHKCDSYMKTISVEHMCRTNQLTGSPYSPANPSARYLCTDILKLIADLKKVHEKHLPKICQVNLYNDESLNEFMKAARAKQRRILETSLIGVGLSLATLLSQER